MMLEVLATSCRLSVAFHLCTPFLAAIPQALANCLPAIVPTRTKYYDQLNVTTTDMCLGIAATSCPITDQARRGAMYPV